MALETLASDWEFAGICQIGGAAGLGAGGFMFEFRSATANMREEVFFVGGGIGLGGNVGGAGAPDFSTGEMSFSSIECDNPFSLIGLHNAGGRLTSGGAAVIVGLGITYISAFTFRESFFHSQGGFGFSAGGFGAGGYTFAGLWKVGRLMTRSSADEERELRRRVEVRGSRSS